MFYVLGGLGGPTPMGSADVFPCLCAFVAANVGGLLGKSSCMGRCGRKKLAFTSFVLTN